MRLKPLRTRMHTHALACHIRTTDCSKVRDIASSVFAAEAKIDNVAVLSSEHDSLRRLREIRIIAEAQRAMGIRNINPIVPFLRGFVFDSIRIPKAATRAISDKPNEEERSEAHRLDSKNEPRSENKGDSKTDAKLDAKETKEPAKKSDAKSDIKFDAKHTIFTGSIERP